MRKREDTVNLGVTLFFIIGFLLLISFDVQEVTGFSVKDFDTLDIEGEVDILVTLKDDSFYSYKDTSKSQQDKFVKLNNLSLINDYDIINALAIKASKFDIKKILNDSNVKRVAFNHKFKVSLDASKSQVKADEVWNKLSKGINLTGSESVCVLDTGVDYNHENLVGRVILGYDFVNDDSDPMDDNGHGTHVAGIIVSNNSNYRGIAFDGKVVAVKVMNSVGGGKYFDILDGIEWCINHKDEYNISVISMSIGTEGSTFSDHCDDIFPEFAELFNNATANNVLIVAAAGNEGKSDSLTSPGCITNVTSVGAVDDNDNIASFSNLASFLDLLAPGVNIMSTLREGGFGNKGGTSMATPHVSAGALIVKQYSNLENLDLDVFDIIDTIKNSGDSVSGRGYTFPRLNIFEALVSLDIFEPKVNSYYTPLDVYDDKSVSLIANATDTFLDSSVLEIGNESYITDEHVLNDLDIGKNITFRFSANDSAGNLDIGDYNSFIVQDGSPVLDDIENLKAQVNKTLDYNVIATDPANDNLVYSDDTDLFDIGNSTGLISFIPSSIANYTVNISVSDGKHLVSDDFILEVLLNNSAPEIVSYSPLNLSLNINENESLEFSVSYEDLDGGSLNVDWYLDGNSVSNDDSYLFVSDYSSAGEYTITVTISDGIDSDSLEWNLIVNNIDLVPIYLGGIENTSWNENTNHSLDLSSYFVDLDGDGLSYNMSLVDNISYSDDILIPDLDFVGDRVAKFYAYDPGMNFAESNIVNLKVNNVPVCWNDILEDSEECDNSQLNNKSCIDHDYDSGSLGCNSECKFDYSGCVINPPPSSGGSTPSGGGGTPISEEKTVVNVEEKQEKVEETLKASSVEEEKPMEGTGDIVKEQEIKPKINRIKTFFIKTGSFFKSFYYKIVSFIKTKF